MLFAVGYSGSYFEVGSPIPEPEPLTSIESPELDAFDALIHLAGDNPGAVLEAERALLGETEEPNGVGMDATLSGVFERAEPRRTGFVGDWLPAQYTDVDGVPDSIPEDAPFFMGFRSGFAGSQAPEPRVTIEEGPFSGGTTMHVSTLDLQLEMWFEQDNHFQRVAKAFSPEHAEEGLVDGVGDSLGASTGIGGVEYLDGSDLGRRGRQLRSRRFRTGGSPFECDNPVRDVRRTAARVPASVPSAHGDGNDGTHRRRR